MELFTTLLAALAQIVWTIVSIVLWVASYLLWGLLWLLLPLAILAFLALRIAERVLGHQVVRGWLKSKVSRWRAGAWDKLKPMAFAVTTAPFRVLAWFVVYAVWHAAVSLFYRPKWRPWPRAWARRWKGSPATQSANRRGRQSPRVLSKRQT